MNLAVLAPLGPVIAVTAVGFLAGRLGWLGPDRVRKLSNLVFTVLTPALLFRTMSQVHIERLDFRPVASYFVAVAIIFFATLAWCGFNRRATVLAVHALLLLTTATSVLELAVMREEHAHATRSTALTVLMAMRNAVIHPVPLPVIAGLVFASLGWTLPVGVDKPLQW